MADHNAHTYFGLRVLEQLPADLRTHVSGDMPAFHLGLYGPDPLIFSLLTKHISDRLHKNWRTESLPGLSKALQKGSATARSFAGGYVPHRGERPHRPGCSRDAGPLGGTGLPQRSVADGHPEQCVLWPWPAHVRRRSGQRKSAGQRTPGPDGGADRPGGPGIGKNPGSDSQPGRQPQARAAPVPHRAAPGRTTAPGRPSPYACGGVSPTHLPTTDPACRRFPGCRVFFCPGGQDMGLSGRTNRGQRV